MSRFFLLGAVLVFMGASSARAADVTLTNVEIKRGDETIRFPSITLVGANVTQAQAQAFASRTASEAERTSFLRNLNASKLLAPEADVLFGMNDAQAMRTMKFFGVEADGLTHGVAAKAQFERGTYWSLAKDGRSAISAELRSTNFLNVDFSEFAEDAGGLMIGSMKSNGALAKIDVRPPNASNADGPLTMDVEDIESDTRYVDSAPVESSVSVKKAVLSFPPGSDAERRMTFFGYPELTMHSSLLSVYDPNKKLLRLKEARFDVENVGSLMVSGNFSAVEPSFFMGDQRQQMAALKRSDLLNLKMRLVDSGLLDKIFAFYSAKTGASPEKLRQGWAAFAMILAPKFLHGDPASYVLASALGDFIQSGSPMTVTIEPTQGETPMKDLIPPYPANVRSEFRVDASVDKPAAGAAAQ